jgi:hypothetical protein
MGFELDFIKVTNTQKLKVIEWIMCYEEPSEIISTAKDNPYKRTKWIASFDHTVTYYMGCCQVLKDHLGSFLKLFKTLDVSKECIVESLYPSIFIKNVPFFAIIYEDLEIPRSSQFMDKKTNELCYTQCNEEPLLKRQFEIKENLVEISKWIYKCPLFMITRIFSKPGSQFLQEAYLKVPNSLKPIKIDQIVKRIEERTLGFIMNFVDGYYACDTRNKEEEVQARKDTEASIKIVLEEYKTFVLTAIIESYSVNNVMPKVEKEKQIEVLEDDLKIEPSSSKK